MIIAVDYDDTLEIKGKINLQLVNALKMHQLQGDTVILWTCREGKTLADALKKLAQVGFKPNYANRNCPQALRMFGHDTRKIYADLYIDDKGHR